MSEIQLPALCSKCLGDSTQLTLVRDLKGEPCRLCTQPFATFSWRKHKLGPKEQSRFCLGCADRNNVCASCYRNFSTGLPLSVHQSALGIAANTAPQALKYAAVKAEVQAAARSSKQEYDQRIDSISQPLLSIGAGDVVEEIRQILTQPPTAPESVESVSRSSTLLIANCDSKLNSQDIEAKLRQFGTVEKLVVYPLARCGFVTFSTIAQAKEAISKFPRGILVLDQIKLRLVWAPHAIEIKNCEKQIATMIQQFMRGKLV